MGVAEPGLERRARSATWSFGAGSGVPSARGRAEKPGGGSERVGNPEREAGRERGSDALNLGLAALLAVGGQTDHRLPQEGGVASPHLTRVGGGLARLLLPTSAAAAGDRGSGLIGRILG